MRLAMIGFVVGVVLLQQQASLLSLNWLLIISFLSGAGYFLSRLVAQVYVRLVLHVLLASAIGFVWASGFAHLYLRDALPVQWENKDITITGTIDSLPFHFDQGVRFNFAIEKISADGETNYEHWPSKIALSWY